MYLVNIINQMHYVFNYPKMLLRSCTKKNVIKIKGNNMHAPEKKKHIAINQNIELK
jgi:hypothetical protein